MSTMNMPNVLNYQYSDNNIVNNNEYWTLVNILSTPMTPEVRKIVLDKLTSINNNLLMENKTIIQPNNFFGSNFDQVSRSPLNESSTSFKNISTSRNLPRDYVRDSSKNISKEFSRESIKNHDKEFERDYLERDYLERDNLSRENFRNNTDIPKDPLRDRMRESLRDSSRNILRSGALNSRKKDFEENVHPSFNSLDSLNHGHRNPIPISNPISSKTSNSQFPKKIVYNPNIFDNLSDDTEEIDLDTVSDSVINNNFDKHSDNSSVLDQKLNRIRNLQNKLLSVRSKKNSSVRNH
ncbi:hypothetical protein QJ850_gp731 [Acanthamoeba polyphaga mimivirus]|uniref:Uncharacterized protein n=1 Tax=Acanthamoeba polyphaga mimivirus Kroon TaxID=3069720 RepID=A0A0G2Y2H0_9VIRU|nr:hypothetical protein QJ850_gp731 [Acanthamoeba polyphaga mimivirus]AKI79968.1 hypothetical protein [Acanthamoeba polyphaga mimivirus Kroon]